MVYGTWFYDKGIYKTTSPIQVIQTEYTKRKDFFSYKEKGKLKDKDKAYVEPHDSACK